MKLLTGPSRDEVGDQVLGVDLDVLERLFQDHSKAIVSVVEAIEAALPDGPAGALEDRVDRAEQLRRLRVRPSGASLVAGVVDGSTRLVPLPLPR